MAQHPGFVFQTIECPKFAGRPVRVVDGEVLAGELRCGQLTGEPSRANVLLHLNKIRFVGICMILPDGTTRELQ